jgi:hypothetical protein
VRSMKEAMIVALQGHEPTSDTTKMRAAASRALSINKKCPEAHNLLAIGADSYDKALECYHECYNTALNLAPQAVSTKAREEALALWCSHALLEFTTSPRFGPGSEHSMEFP